MGDNYNRITIKRAEELVVLLSENSSTGYQWVAEKVKGLSIVSERLPATNDLIGSAGVRRFSVQAADLGEYKIIIRYCRAWESEGNRADQFQITVVIYY